MLLQENGFLVTAQEKIQRHTKYAEPVVNLLEERIGQCTSRVVGVDRLGE